MAFGTPTVIASTFATANDSALVLSGVNLVAGRLYVLFYGAHRSTSGGGAPDLSTGYTIEHDTTDRTSDWVFEGQSEQTAEFASGSRRIAAYSLIPASGETNITLTVDPTGGANSNNAGILVEIPDGFDSTTPIAQAKAAVSNDTSGITIALDSAPAADSLSLAAFEQADATSAIDPRTGWTEIGEVTGTGGSSDSGGLQAQYKDPGETTAEASASGTFKWAGIHLEIAAAAGSGVSGSGSPTATLSASASGTATQSFTGSGSPTATLSASASGSGTNTPDDSTGSGSPTATLSASASGTATQSFNGSGSPTVTLGVSASGTATQSMGGSGSPTATLSASASGTATQTFTGSGTPTTALTASASGTATHDTSITFGFDAVTENVAAADPQEFTHTPGTDLVGVVLMLSTTAGDTDIVSSVTYGGQAMTRVRTDDHVDGRKTWLYVLTTGVPTGAQTVSIDRTEGTSEIHAVCATITGNEDIEVLDHDGTGTGQSGNSTDPSVLLSYSGRTGLAFGCTANSRGGVGAVTEGAGMTRLADHDFGTTVAVASRQTSTGTSDFTFEYTIALASIAMSALAVAEVQAPDHSGTGSPTATLSASASGDAAQVFTGTSAATASLSASASGSGTNTPPAAGSSTGSGSPTATLVASVTADATHEKDTFVGSGSPVRILTPEASGVATQTFNGSGSPTATLSATVGANVNQTGYSGPTPVAAAVVSSSADQDIAWPGAQEIGDVALLFIATANQAVPPLTFVSGSGTDPDFQLISGATDGIGNVGASAAVRIETYWSRATATDMGAVTIPDPGSYAIAAIVTFRGCATIGNPWDALATHIQSPATDVSFVPDLTTLTPNSLVVAGISTDPDRDGPPGVIDTLTNAALQSITEHVNHVTSVGNGGGLAVFTGQKLDAGATGTWSGDKNESTRAAIAAIALKPPVPSTGAGTPTATLSGSGSGVGTSTVVGATGAPVVTLVATASGSAVFAGDHTASGNITVTLTVTGSGVATMAGGTVTVSGDVLAVLSASGSGNGFSTSLPDPRPEPPPAQGGTPRRRHYVVVVPERPKKKRRRRKKQQPTPVPEARELPAVELPPLPALSVRDFDPNLWLSLTAITPRPVAPPELSPAEVAEEERFIAAMLERF